MIFHKEPYFRETPNGKVPSDWEIVKLGDKSELIVPMRDKPKHFGGDIPWIRIEDLDGIYVWGSKSERKVSRETIAKMNLKPYPTGTVLCSCSGEMGVCAITKTILTSNQTFIGIVPNDDLNPEYLYFLLTYFKPKLQTLGTGTTIPYLSREKFEKLQIPKPSLSEQRAIVGVLGTGDLAIQKTEEAIAKTERLKKGLMQQLLTRGIGHTEYKDTPTGTIPDSWQTSNLGEVLIDIKYGTSAKANSEVHGYPVLGIPNVIGGKINQTNLRYADLSDAEKRSLTLEDGDILLVRTNANPDYIGRCALFEKMKGIWLYASYLIRIRPDRKKVLPAYLVRFLQSEKGRKQFLSIARTSAGNYNINSQEIRRITFNLPRLPEQLNEQQRIVEILSVVDEKLDFETREKEKMEKIKKGLMDLLLTGKIRVKVD